jgi:protein TonB
MSDKNTKYDLFKQKYRKILESSGVLSILILTLLFYSFKTFKYENKLPKAEVIVIEALPPLQTQQNKPKPPPSRPQIPVETEEDELLDDVTIADTDINFNEINTDVIAPPDDPDEIFEFFAVSEKPELIKHVKPIYPELAQRANIEGTVTLKLLIDTKGNVEKTEILKSIPMLDEAAVKAAMQCKFKPAKQRDKFVKVWMSVPFKFYLRTRSL